MRTIIVEPPQFSFGIAHTLHHRSLRACLLRIRICCVVFIPLWIVWLIQIVTVEWWCYGTWQELVCSTEHSCKSYKQCTDQLSFNVALWTQRPCHHTLCMVPPQTFSTLYQYTIHLHFSLLNHTSLGTLSLSLTFDLWWLRHTNTLGANRMLLIAHTWLSIPHIFPTTLHLRPFGISKLPKSFKIVWLRLRLFRRKCFYALRTTQNRLSDCGSDSSD